MFIIVKNRPCLRDLAHLLTVLADSQYESKVKLTKCIIMKCWITENNMPFHRFFKNQFSSFLSQKNNLHMDISGNCY